MIKLDSVSKRFDNRLLFVSLSLRVFRGETLFIQGANGSGKSTLLRLISGHIKADGGSIERERPLDQKRSRYRYMGILFEGNQSFYGRLSAWDNLLYFSTLRELFGPETRKELERLLQEINLFEFRHERVEVLSRGMQQKLSLILAFVGNPELILLDEPTLGLDESSLTVWREWVARAKKRGKTLILTSHQPEWIVPFADNIYALKEGLCVPICNS